MMKFLITRRNKLAVLLTGLIFAVGALIVAVPVRSAVDDETAALYKTKCVACHGATAEKKFDVAKADDELIQAVLKGKKMEKPPNMPGFEEKGISADQAKALVAYMKSLKQ